MNQIKLIATTIAIFAAISTAALAQDAAAPAHNPRALNRIEHRLNITPQQREQARAILQQEQPQLRQMRLSLVAERKEMAAASTGGVFDPAAVHAIALKYADANANAAVERAKLRTELVGILTAEQKEKLQQFRTRMGAELDSHMLTLGDTL
jgi:Spy/CpxP family protein refolding chaperone